MVDEGCEFAGRLAEPVPLGDWQVEQADADAARADRLAAVWGEGPEAAP